MPHLIHRYPVNLETVIFMISTFEFQIQPHSQRPWIRSILSECHDPKQAFENWMKRNHLLVLELIRQAKEYGYRVIIVDGSVNIQTRFKAVNAQFQL